MSIYGETTKQYVYEWICSLRQEYNNDMDFLSDILAILADMYWRTD